MMPSFPYYLPPNTWAIVFFIIWGIALLFGTLPFLAYAKGLSRSGVVQRRRIAKLLYLLYFVFIIGGFVIWNY